MITTTWFYNTLLTNSLELQSILLSDKQSTLPKLKSIFLSGSVGAGKTTQSLLLVRDYILATQESQGWHYSFEPDYITFHDLIQICQDRQFGTDQQKDSAFYRLKEITETPFLILDDIHTDLSSNYQKSQMDSLLLQLFSVRFANRTKQKTIIISNCTEKEIRSYYPEAVCSRIFGICEYLEVQGKDKRVIVTKELQKESQVVIETVQQLDPKRNILPEIMEKIDQIKANPNYLRVREENFSILTESEINSTLSVALGEDPKLKVSSAFTWLRNANRDKMNEQKWITSKAKQKPLQRQIMSQSSGDSQQKFQNARIVL